MSPNTLEKFENNNAEIVGQQLDEVLMVNDSIVENTDGEELPRIILTGRVARIMRAKSESSDRKVVLSENNLAEVHDIDLITTGEYKTKRPILEQIKHLPDVQNLFPTENFYYDRSLHELVYKSYEVNFKDKQHPKVALTTPEAELVVTVSTYIHAEDDTAKIQGKIQELMSDKDFTIENFKKLALSYAKGVHRATESNLQSLTLPEIIRLAKKANVSFDQALTLLSEKDDYQPIVDYNKFAACLKTCTTPEEVLAIQYDAIKQPTRVEKFLAELQEKTLRR